MLFLQETLTVYIASLNCTIEEFYDEVNSFNNEDNDPYITQFIECLLASADYDSFYKVMAREGKKYKAASAAIVKKAESKMADDLKEPSSPSKASAAADSKGGGIDLTEIQYKSDSKSESK